MNVEGTRNVLWAMQRAGVPRIVFVSPVTVLATGRPLVRVDERVEAPRKALGWYHRTKLEAERWVLRSAGDGLEPVVVRLAMAWGPGDRVWLPRFRELVRTGRFRWVDFGRHQVSTTHVANAAHGLVLAADRGMPGEVYHLGDGEPVELREFVTRYLATAGVKAPKRNVTPRGGRVLAGSGERIWGFLGAKKAPPLTWATYAVTGPECTVDDAKARAELGYAPVVEHDRAMEELAADAAAKRRGRSAPGPA